jgi:methyl-accepting chemotaxis protein
MSRVEELEDVVVNLHQRVRLLSDDLASAKLAMQHAVDALAEVEKGRETMRAALREIDGIASMLVDALPEPINTQMWTIRDKISCALGKEV